MLLFSNSFENSLELQFIGRQCRIVLNISIDYYFCFQVCSEQSTDIICSGHATRKGTANVPLLSLGLQAVERSIFRTVRTIHWLRWITSFPCDVSPSWIPRYCRCHRDHFEGHCQAIDTRQSAAVHQHTDVRYAKGNFVSYATPEA